MCLSPSGAIFVSGAINRTFFLKAFCMQDFIAQSFTATGKKKSEVFLKWASEKIVIPTVGPILIPGLQILTHSLIHHFETVPNSKQMQTTTEMSLWKDLNVQIA